jgi:hypothetical protein
VALGIAKRLSHVVSLVEKSLNSSQENASESDYRDDTKNDAVRSWCRICLESVINVVVC